MDDVGYLVILYTFLIFKISYYYFYITLIVAFTIKIVMLQYMLDEINT